MSVVASASTHSTRRLGAPSVFDIRGTLLDRFGLLPLARCPAHKETFTMGSVVTEVAASFNLRIRIQPVIRSKPPWSAPGADRGLC